VSKIYEIIFFDGVGGGLAEELLSVCARDGQGFSTKNATAMIYPPSLLKIV